MLLDIKKVEILFSHCITILRLDYKVDLRYIYTHTCVYLCGGGVCIF